MEGGGIRLRQALARCCLEVGAMPCDLLLSAGHYAFPLLGLLRLELQEVLCWSILSLESDVTNSTRLCGKLGDIVRVRQTGPLTNEIG